MSETKALFQEFRKGFIRLAIQSGAALVPCYSFGENDIYEQADNPKVEKKTKNLQDLKF